MFNRVLLAGAALCALGSVANATPVLTASLFSPQSPSGSLLTPITIAGATAPSQTGVVGAGYSIAFSGVASDEGIVRGDLAGRHAVPVAGVTSSGVAEYLTGDFGSGLTTNAASAGAYFSTGDGAASITVTFATPQISLALLWGSIDTGNLIQLNNGDTITGAQVQSAASGFLSNGFQGPAGSAYVAFTDAPFTSVTFSSSVPSFEFAAIAGSNTPFSVPEPISLAVFGASLVGFGAARKAFRR